MGSNPIQGVMRINREYFCISIISENSAYKYNLLISIINEIKNKKRINYYFSNYFNIINLLDINKINKEVKFLPYNGLEDMISLIMGFPWLKDTILIFDNVSMLNLEVIDNINYFVRLNLFLSYIRLMTESKDSIAIFLVDSIKDPVFNLIKYWCDFEISLNIEGNKPEIKVKDMDSNLTKIIDIEDLKQWIA